MPEAELVLEWLPVPVVEAPVLEAEEPIRTQSALLHGNVRC